MKSKEEIDQEEYIKFQQIGFVLSEENKKQKQLQEPFLKRLLLNIEQCTKPEQELYKFILQNWLWCVPIWANLDKIDNPAKLKGYRMLNKEEVMKRAFDFG